MSKSHTNVSPGPVPEPTSGAEADRLQTPHLRAGEFVWNLRRLSWNETLARARADHRRIVSFLAAHKARPQGHALFHPSFVCAFLYRISNHWFRAGHPHVARFVWHLNLLLTGADVDPRADLGEGLVILSPPGTAIMGTAGRNLTVMPCAGLGGAVGRSVDIGAGPGLPFLGDDVLLEPHCGVLGPVRVGHRVRVGAGIPLTEDVPDDTYVEGYQARFLRRRDLP